jgi:hypothetical protein
MSTVDSVVRSTIQDFVRDGVLFTALDVSNKVKEVLPFARHREVRDLVRAAFVTDIEPASYAKTPITVTLGDGTTAEALLYHPLVDSWDLDAKYDAQKRAQTAARPNAQSQVSATVVSPTPSPAPVSVNVVAPVATAPTVPVAAAPAAPTNSRALWDSLFKSQPSLFPRR